MNRMSRRSVAIATAIMTLTGAVSVFVLREQAAAISPIVIENTLAGSPASEWDVVGAGDPSIQGFATDVSVDQGGTVEFKVGDPTGPGGELDPSAPADFRVDVYRIGWYGGDGARLVATVPASATAELDPPACAQFAATGLVDCGTWPIAATWTVPTDATSGVYIGRLVREDTGGASHVPFVVRDDDGGADILLQTSDTTWQAYNRYGGNSLYQGTGPGTGGGSDGRAYAVSYNRPLTVRGDVPEDSFFNAEYPMVRWLERNGYDVSYSTGVDTHRAGAELLEHDVFMSVGHDEYWSGPQRTNVEAARDAGVHLAFFSGNEVFWRTRYEASIDGAATPDRTLVSYKETHAHPNNPDPTGEWTGTWRDPRDPDSVDLPENGLTGTIFTVNCCTYDMNVPAEDGQLRLWRNSSVATSPGDDVLGSGILGYEWDEDLDNGARPGGQIRMSSTTVAVPQRVVESAYGSTFAAGTATHALTMHRATSGALVFGAGTVQWSWGLDDQHDRGNAPPITAVQQATVNLFGDMGVQPGTLQSDLVAATSSSDTTPPTSAITSPADGSTIDAGSTVTITGTATDVDGLVGGVEVSVDGGLTWRRADGRSTWSYTFTSPVAVGESVTILSRATDDSSNTETPGTGATVTTQQRTCPCSLFGEGLPQPDAPILDAAAIELGLRFQATEDGFVKGVRFYAYPQNIGPHIGRLWDASGTKLAEVTFGSGTTPGWQEAMFDAPVAVSADTNYVVSYFTPTGFYAATPFGLTAAIENPPLRALASDGSSGPGGNGVYKYAADCADTTAGCFPDQSFNSTNYWVDPVFDQTDTDSTPPEVTATEPGDGAAGVETTAAATATFTERLDPTTVTASTFTLDGPGGPVPSVVTYDDAERRATLTPDATLDPGATYTATLTGGEGGIADLAGNPLAADLTWTFTAMVDLQAGPGGPVLVVGDSTNPTSFYLTEILRAEGLNLFTTADVADLDAALLADHDVVVLGDTTLTLGQVTELTSWVDAGGDLVAMRPDPQLAPLLGLTPGAGSQTGGYLRVDGTGPGEGITTETMQFHGDADLFDLDVATAVAMLYSDAATATPYPAVTTREVGGNGGSATAFTFDLAASVIATRQGNIAWAGLNGDGSSGPVRADDMFHNGTDPDWVNLDKVAIPQADEQQRLLVNLVTRASIDQQPLPRLWYFPRNEQAVVVMTMDDHNSTNVGPRLDSYLAADPAGCAVDDWECVRATTYMYPDNPLTASQTAAYETQGFEFALHTNTGCADFTPASLATAYETQLSSFAAAYPDVAPSRTNRTHCIAFTDWSSQPLTQLDNGIRLDTNYYYWPPEWVQDRPGMFTGSGIPMRFADVDGTMIDVFQAPTQMTDESGQSYPATIDALLDAALGPDGYVGAFVANAHTDGGPNAENMAAAIVASAQARDVPVVSATQLLDWLDARNASSITGLGWDGTTLAFTVAADPAARGLTALVPATTEAGTITSLALDGVPVDLELEVVKGVSYAVVGVAEGTYTATYAPDLTPPNLVGTTPADGATDVSRATDLTATFDEPLDTATVVAANVTVAGPTGTVAIDVAAGAGGNDVVITPTSPLALGATYTVELTGIADRAGNLIPAAITWTFTTAGCPCTIFGGTGGGGGFNDGQPIETGVRFRSDDDGEITAVRFHKPSAAGTDYVGNLWSNTGTLLGTTGPVTLPPGASGWQEIALTAPVEIDAATTYVASVLSTSGDYGATVPGLATTVLSPPLRALADGEDGPNGVYRYGGGFPTDTFNSGNYWIDVVFDLGDVEPPTVIGRLPGPDATGVDVGTAVEITLSEPVDPASLGPSAVRLRAQGAGADVPADVDVDGATLTLTPSGPLGGGTRYTVTVDGAVTDLAGNPLGDDVTWSFTTVVLCGVDVPGLIGWWPGADSLDALVGPGLGGSAAFADAVVGRGMLFDGATTVGTGTLTTVSTGVSVEAWIRPDQTGRVQAIVSRWDFPSTDDTARSYNLLLLPNGDLLWETDETSTRRPEVLRAAAPQLFDGDFHHVAATWDGTAIVVYVDGDEIASKPSQRGDLNPADQVSFRLGSTAGRASFFGFTGIIDEPAVYDRALTAPEVAAIHSAGSAGKCTPT